MRPRRHGADRPLYMIGIAADLAGMHPQTLRIYERKRLVQPQRTQGNTRLYSDADIERLRLIQELTQVEGINLAGVERILALDIEVKRLRADVARLRRELEHTHARMAEDALLSRRVVCTQIVHVPRGGMVVRRDM